MEGIATVGLMPYQVSMGVEFETQTPGPRFFIVAGEPSGDTHAAHLMRALASRLPGSRFRGFGGNQMQAQGLHCLADLPASAIMGLFPVIAALPKIRGWFRDALVDLEANRPDAIILVDYPGFNLRLAARAKAMGILVIYYISPQIWAWNRRRVKKIKKIVDLMIVILPFEAEFYRGSGVNVFYSGHPLIDHLEESPPDPESVRELRSIGGSPVIGVFPGSRAHVVESLWPVFLRTMGELANRHGMAESTYLIAAAKEELADIIRRSPELRGIRHRLVVGRPYDVMEASDVCLTTSGTTTLEIAFFKRPMVLAYRVSPVLWGIGRLVIRVKHIGLVNLIANRSVVPEHIGVRSFHVGMADDLASIWTDPKRRDAVIDGLKLVREKLATPGSYDRAAEAIARRLESAAPKGPAKE